MSTIFGGALLAAHGGEWDPSSNVWHIVRPILGGIFGLIAFLAFTAVISAATQHIVLPSGSASVVYAIVAFLAGFREESFRELLKKFTDLFLAPGTSTGAKNTPSNPTDASGKQNN